MKKHIPTLLAEIRTATSWTEKQLAAEIGVSQPTVNRILHGQERYRADTYCAVIALHEAKCSATTKATP